MAIENFTSPGWQIFLSPDWSENFLSPGYVEKVPKSNFWGLCRISDRRFLRKTYFQTLDESSLIFRCVDFSVVCQSTITLDVCRFGWWRCWKPESWQLNPMIQELFYCRGVLFIRNKEVPIFACSVRLQFPMRGNGLPNIRKEVLPCDWSPIFWLQVVGR